MPQTSLVELDEYAAQIFVYGDPGWTQIQVHVHRAGGEIVYAPRPGRRLSCLGGDGAVQLIVILSED
jgi:hypothetical protein